MGRQSHGHARKGKITPEWRAWASMRTRCLNLNHQAYDRYGGRGIIICERWDSFEAFFEDMGKRPSSAHSLDRVDNEGNYTPGNCRWATRKEQARNTRGNRLLTIDGETLPAAEWAERAGLKYTVLKDRLRKGWKPRLAVFTARRPDDLLKVGQRFGAWTVVGDAKPSTGGKKRYHVRCDCGIEADVQSYDLRKAKSTWCRSCSSKQIFSKRETIVRGSRFGFWTVLEESGRDKWGLKLFLCVCKCGTERPVAGRDLKRARSTRCRPCSRKTK